MANAHELARGHKRLRVLIEFALAEGWHVVRTPGGHLKFTKSGCASIFTSSTASDHRANLNARSQLRRADRQARDGTIGESAPGEDSHG
ncbi:MAG: type II toxin-antitoxin system HicA family toxin [Burkholderiales bacterium]|nr:type II toxin-antitoxin system HicA family toxin [Burkholderiales bacterium]